METTLTRRQERWFAELQARHGRKKSDFCVCEGVRCCTELLSSPALGNIEIALVTPETRPQLRLPESVPTAEVPAARLQELSGTVNSQGILILVRRPATTETASPVADPFIFAVDKLGDPGNFGTMLRTARAAGLHEFWYTAGSVDPFSAKVIRSALAAQFSMTLREFPTLDGLAKNAAALGFETVYLTDPHQGESCFECEGLFARSVIVIGSEAHGVDSAARGTRVTIPMPGEFESLNAAQAATIVLFEHVRRSTGKQRR